MAGSFFVGCMLHAGMERINCPNFVGWHWSTGACKVIIKESKIELIGVCLETFALEHLQQALYKSNTSANCSASRVGGAPATRDL
jgi:hypothetical protein